MRRLYRLLEDVRRRGPAGLEERELLEIHPLYRQAATLLARERAGAWDPETELALRRLVERGHALLYRPRPDPRPWSRRAAAFLLGECPRAVRAEWRLLAGVFAAFYTLAALSFVAVRRDLDLAWTLMDEGAVQTTIEQLRATEDGQPFTGNFTFGLGRSPEVAGTILAHNIGVSVLCFGAGLMPPLYLWILSSNALMVGTYTAIAAHWGQAGAISSILWCHGVIELQMIVLAGAAGLVLARAVLRPGARTRRSALARAGSRAWALFAPVAPLLVISGLIEGFVSPHAPTPVRALVALGSAAALLAWALLGGRHPRGTPQPDRTALLQPGRQ